MKKLIIILGLILPVVISSVYGSPDLTIDLTTNPSEFKVGGVMVITEKDNSSEEINCYIQFEVDPISLLLLYYGYVYIDSDFKYFYKVSTVPERTVIHLNMLGIEVDIVINRALYYYQ